MTMLRSTSLLLLTLGGAACGLYPSPPDEDVSGSTTTADSSTGPGGSATSTTGGRPSETATSTAVETTTSSSSGPVDDTGESFLLIPDGGICVLGGAPDGFQPRCSYCDVGAQDCPDGEKCVPWANDGGDTWNATRCSEIPENPGGPGEPCVVEGSPVSGIDDCELGLLCFEVDPRTLQGTCTALCDPNQPTVCAEDEVCVDDNGFAPYVCLPRCDPFDPASCAADETCRAIGDDILCVPTVTLPQGLECGMEGQYCAADQACRPEAELGNCVDPECCTLWCDLSAPDPNLPCSAMPAELCRPFFEAPPPGHEHVGVCGLPR